MLMLMESPSQRWCLPVRCHLISHHLNRKTRTQTVEPDDLMFSILIKQTLSSYQLSKGCF